MPGTASRHERQMLRRAKGSALKFSALETQNSQQRWGMGARSFELGWFNVNSLLSTTPRCFPCRGREDGIAVTLTWNEGVLSYFYSLVREALGGHGHSFPRPNALVRLTT